MSVAWAQYPALCNGRSFGFDATNSIGTAVAPGTANAKGSWVQLSAALDYDVAFVYISAMTKNGITNPVNYALDIGIGASGSEVVVVPNLICPNGSNAFLGRQYSIPLRIPAGTRVAARCQASNVSGTNTNLYVCFSAFDSDYNGEGITGYDAIGFVSASTKGTQLTGSGSSNTKGSYTQLISAAARDYAGFMLSLDQLGVGGGANDCYAVDVAIGASSSEKDIVPNMVLSKDDQTEIFLHSFLPLPILSGVRISSRYQSTDNNTANAPNIVLYGGYK